MSNLGELTIKLILVAFPGLLASRVYRKLNGRRIRQKWEDLVEILIFSVLGYLLFYAVAWLGCLSESLMTQRGWLTRTYIPRPVFPISHGTLDSKSDPLWLPIFSTVPIGAALGFVASWAERYQAIWRVGKRLGMAAGAGDAEVWLGFSNERTRDRWVFVEDHKASIIYRAGIDTFSRWATPEGEHELVLEEVTAYRSAGGDEIGVFDYVYICRNKKDLTIRIPSEAPARENAIVVDLPGEFADTRDGCDTPTDLEGDI